MCTGKLFQEKGPRQERARWAQIDVLSLWIDWLDNKFPNSLETIGFYVETSNAEFKGLYVIKP